jgi:hypothetical protein
MKKGKFGLMSLHSRLWFGAAVASLLWAAPGRAQDLSHLPALAPALNELKTELALTNEQSSEAATVIVDLLGSAQGVLDGMDGLNFDSILDLLVEVRSMKEEFGPRLGAVLTEEQREKLAELPKRHQIYSAAVSGWLTEALAGKLNKRVELTDQQLPQVRSLLLERFQEVAGIVEGLVKKDEDENAKDTILGAILDLRSIQRQTRRDVAKLLNDDQRARLEEYWKDSKDEEKK